MIQYKWSIRLCPTPSCIACNIEYIGYRTTCLAPLVFSSLHIALHSPLVCKVFNSYKFESGIRDNFLKLCYLGFLKCPDNSYVVQKAIWLRYAVNLLPVEKYRKSCYCHLYSGICCWMFLACLVIKFLIG